MKKILFIITLIWFIQSCSGGNKLTSSWHDSLKNKNARLSFQYDEDSHLLYRVSNNKDFLYIDLIADQEELKRALLFTGLNIWIDSTAKAKELQGLQLVSSQIPPKRNGQPMLTNHKPDPANNSFDKKMDFNKIMNLETIGLAFELIDYTIHPDSLGGVYFSFKIPVEKITRKNQTPPVLSLIIESTETSGDSGMSGGPSGGPGGGPGGGQGGGMMQGGMGGGQGMPSGGQGMQGGGGPGGPGGGQGGGPSRPPPGSQSQDIKIKIKKLQLATNEYAK